MFSCTGYYDRIDKNQNQNLKKTFNISLYPVHIGCRDISDITMGNEKSNHQILHKKISVITIAISKPVLDTSEFSSLQIFFFVG